jgi:hypothetical protein
MAEEATFLPEGDISMAVAIKSALIIFILIGIFLISYGAGEMWKTVRIISASSGSAQLQESSVEAMSALDHAESGLKRFLNSTIGPVSVKAILMASGIFMGLALIVTVVAGLYPYVTQMGFGAGGRLMAALQEERFDEARRMIEAGSGINTVNEFGQNPLLIALEAGRMDLAVLLIKAGNDVNIKSKMHVTPLRVAAEAGDLETVKLLLGKGASPQHPDDRIPPFFYAMTNGHDEIARLLLEVGTDLHRRYPLQDGRTATVGDFTILAGKDKLVALIRQRGGTFSQQ